MTHSWLALGSLNIIVYCFYQSFLFSNKLLLSSNFPHLNTKIPASRNIVPKKVDYRYVSPTGCIRRCSTNHVVTMSLTCGLLKNIWHCLIPKYIEQGSENFPTWFFPTSSFIHQILYSCNRQRRFGTGVYFSKGWSKHWDGLLQKATPSIVHHCFGSHSLMAAELDWWYWLNTWLQR